MNHPYRDIPDDQRWSRAMAGRAIDDIDPVQDPPFRVGSAMRVVTAGSCFAQHVARYMRASGLACFETEPAHPLLTEELAQTFNYGIYAARYGNIYTPRQLLQLWRRANGTFVPQDDVWQEQGAWFDPFRPTIQPAGFSSIEEYRADRHQHFAAVRKAFGVMDVMIFTLGLTECWASRRDGAVYPLCPGVAAGRFDAQDHVFINLTLEDIVADLRAFLEEVRQINPNMRLILTVSPVPLAATAERHHVLQANTYSKALLRVAAEQVSRLPNVYYFPAYEIVIAAGDRYFAEDRRTILEDGVGRVMSLFFKHVLDEFVPLPLETEQDDFVKQGQAIVDTLCDEQRLDSHAALAKSPESQQVDQHD